jgi:uncharacterized membrane protein HdeD (DUF308 family)
LSARTSHRPQKASLWPLARRAEGSVSSRMSAGLARNWWAVGLRGILTVPFGLSVLVPPSPTVASFVLLFSVYIAGDGIFAILAGSLRRVAASAGRR